MAGVRPPCLARGGVVVSVPGAASFLVSMGSQQDPRDWSRALRDAAPLLGLGTSLAVTVALALAAGYWVDGRLGTRPLFFLVGAAFGLAGALMQIYKVGRKP